MLSKFFKHLSKLKSIHVTLCIIFLYFKRLIIHEVLYVKNPETVMVLAHNSLLRTLYSKLEKIGLLLSSSTIFGSYFMQFIDCSITNVCWTQYFTIMYPLPCKNENFAVGSKALEDEFFQKVIFSFGLFSILWKICIVYLSTWNGLNAYPFVMRW